MQILFVNIINNFFFNFYFKNIKVLYFFYYDINFEFKNVFQFLNFMYIKNYSFFQRENFIKQIINDSFIDFPVYEGRLKFDFLNNNHFQILNISEFAPIKIFAGQKEIYLNLSKNRLTLFLNDNFIIQKNYKILNNYQNILDRNFYNYFIKFMNIGNFFFVQYRIYGLGFRLKKSSLYGLKVLRFEIGFGHFIYYFLPNNIKCFKRKRRFFIFSDNLYLLRQIKKHIDSFKPLNSYKIRGLKDLKYNIKLKKGKKQSKK
jgi:hypothetical protein